MIQQEFVDQVKNLLAAGKTKEQVYFELLQQGQKVDAISDAYALAHFDENKEDTQKMTIRVLVVIGALLIGAGVFSFVAANWEHMSKLVKVLVIVLAMISAYTGGWHLRENKGMTKAGLALIFLGSLLYGAGIFLIAQIFNMRQNWADGMILWFFGVLMLAWVYDSILFYIFALVLGFISVFSNPMFQFDEMNRSILPWLSVFLIGVATVASYMQAKKIRSQMKEELKDIY